MIPGPITVLLRLTLACVTLTGPARTTPVHPPPLPGLMTTGSLPDGTTEPRPPPAPPTSPACRARSTGQWPTAYPAFDRRTGQRPASDDHSVALCGLD